MAELRDGKSGVVRLGAIEPAASRRVTPLLSRLRADRPGLTIRLDVSGTTGVSRAVADADLDVGLCSAPPVELGLTFEPLYEEEMVLLLPRGHRLARKRSVAAADLDGEPLALSEQGCAYRSAIEAALQTRGVRPRWAFESGSTATLRAAVRHRLALAFLPRGAVQPPPAGTLARRLKDLAIALPVGLVTRPNAPPPPPALADLVALLRAELRATPSR